MPFGFQGETVSLKVNDPVYNPYDPGLGLTAFGRAEVGNGLEFSPSSSLYDVGGGSTVNDFSLDVSSNKIKIALDAPAEDSYFADSPFDGYVLNFSHHNGYNITGVTVLATDISNFVQGDVSFTNHSVAVNGSELQLQANVPPYVVLGFQFEKTPHQAAKALLTGE